MEYLPDCASFGPTLPIINTTQPIAHAHVLVHDFSIDKTPKNIVFSMRRINRCSPYLPVSRQVLSGDIDVPVHSAAIMHASLANEDAQREKVPRRLM